MTGLPDFGAQRTAIAAVIEQVDVVLYASAPTGPMPAAFVIVGMPSWKPPTAAVGWHQVTWPIMVAVSRSGVNDAVDATRLETLWPEVFEVLDTATDTDPGFGGVAYSSLINDAYFDPVTIAGQDFPAQIINLILQGE